LLLSKGKRNVMRDPKQPEITPEADVDEPVLPPWPTLSEFAEETDANEGVQIDGLTPGTKVRVQTKNSEYWVTVLEGGHRRVLVQGGILPTVSEARLEGATDGGTALHSGWIEVNRSLELACGPRRIITSRVRGITVEKPMPSVTRAA
jgi:hypothetical protein